MSRRGYVDQLEALRRLHESRDVILRLAELEGLKGGRREASLNAGEPSTQSTPVASWKPFVHPYYPSRAPSRPRP